MLGKLGGTMEIFTLGFVVGLLLGVLVGGLLICAFVVGGDKE